MSSTPFRVPHAFTEADHTNAVSAAEAAACFAQDEYDCRYEEPYDTVHEVQSLRSKRRREGYYADDGATRVVTSDEDLVGADGARIPGRMLADAYDEEWIADRLVRQRMLDDDPYYRFASYVSAGSNLPLGEFVNDNLVRAETQRRVAAAQQRVREQNEQRLQALATPAEIERMRQRAADARAEEESARKSSTLLEASLECYSESKVQANAQFEQLVQFLRARSLFDRFTASAVALRGVRGYENTLPITQRMIAEISQSAITDRLSSVRNSPRADRVRENMPTSANLALYEALLALAVGDAELMALVARATPEQLALFEDKSEYSADPEEYARDLATLARLLFQLVRGTQNSAEADKNTATSSLLLFDKITHTLYAHLNKMRRRALLDDATYPPLRRPIIQERRARRRLEVSLGGGTVIIDADDEDLEAVAEGEPVTSLEPSELASVQSTLGDNQSIEQTPRLVEALLEPMASILYNSVFYSTSTRGPLDDGLDYEAYAGGALPEDNERQRLAPRFNQQRSVVLSPFYEVWLALAFAIVRSEWRDDSTRILTRDSLLRLDVLQQGAKFNELVFSALKQELPLIDRNRREYRARVRERLVRSSRMLLCAAQSLVSAFDNGSGTRILGLTDDELKTLRDYISSVERSEFPPGSARDARLTAAENAAYRLLSRSRPTGVGTGLETPLLKNQSSLIAFDEALIDDDEIRSAKSAIDLREIEAQKRADEIEEQARKLARELNNTLDRETGVAETRLAEALQLTYVPSASEAMAPINSGILLYSELMMASLQQAYDKLREFVPCLAHTFCNYNALIESDVYWSLFASLVQAHVRLVDARNPVVYRPDATEQRARIQIRSALDSLRRAARDDYNVAHHGGRCNCGVQNGAGLYPALQGYGTSYSNAVRSYTMRSRSGFGGMAIGGF